MQELTINVVHKLLSDADKEKTFQLCTGIYVRNLHELKDSLNHMNEETFNFHVNESKNDFYNWIVDVIQDSELGERIRDIKKQNALCEEIGDRIIELEGVEHKFEEPLKEIKTAIDEIKENIIVMPKAETENKSKFMEFLKYGSKNFYLGFFVGLLMGLILAKLIG